MEMALAFFPFLLPLNLLHAGKKNFIHKQPNRRLNGGFILTEMGSIHPLTVPALILSFPPPPPVLTARSARSAQWRRRAVGDAQGGDRYTHRPCQHRIDVRPPLPHCRAALFGHTPCKRTRPARLFCRIRQP